MRAVQHFEDNWVQYLVTFIVLSGIVVWSLMFFEWLHLPTCQTVAEYSPGIERPEGSRYRERAGDLVYDCRVPKYLPTR